jgi:hypothetical protein
MRPKKEKRRRGMYDIILNSSDDCGNRLGVVLLRHKPMDADKIVRLREDMAGNGWQGRPILMAAHVDGADCRIALTGTHRLAAAADLLEEIPVVSLPDDLSPEHWDCIEGAMDDDEMINKMIEAQEERGDDALAEAIALLKQEIESNNQ